MRTTGNSSGSPKPTTHWGRKTWKGTQKPTLEGLRGLQELRNLAVTWEVMGGGKGGGRKMDLDRRWLSESRPETRQDEG